MDWIHCNACAFQLGQQPKRNFRLTSCGHIFCHVCEISASIEKCKMCSIQCTTTPLSPEMTPEVQTFFEDPETIVAKIVRVLEFQKNHRIRLNEYYRTMKDKYLRLKIAFQEMDKENKLLKKELESYKKNNNVNFLTPPQPGPLGYPLFSRNSQVSQAIRGMSRSGSGSINSPLFTPSPLAHGNSGYRTQNNTPQTPSSNASTPASGSSRQSYRSGQSRRPYQDLPHPLTNGLDLLSVSSQRPRNSAGY